MTPTELADALHANATIVPDVTGVMVPVALLLDASHALRRLGRVEAALVGFVDCFCDVCQEHSAIVECPHVVKMHDLCAALRTP